MMIAIEMTEASLGRGKSGRKARALRMRMPYGIGGKLEFCGKAWTLLMLAMTNGPRWTDALQHDLKDELC